ncbi:16S rRNA (guanine(527)-N(7))-methyltransferase RsmG [Candidatus Kinetoplastidibacterium galati]|uniref:Ribosomal RNA small subunit methyltransferase G n=1 Tax=Candidatus Kinetoplastidibacterium galati TCC219 TaxID=1208921 RepID=M1LV71_9PROT|nr:16S rRNA (guanine(527)-N(7))-methyltransferase RsmG [Candidatus Kinetoplastibacterium galatii]AGF49447.1 glucose inhibited division protein B [Candidatus Kinetoplastibacterium galatii TCC219]
MDLYRNNFSDEVLSDACSAINIKISDDQKILLSNYLSMMQKWNKYSNITSIKDYKCMLTYHIVDSLSVIPLLDSLLKKNITICDVGSGAGLPGIVLAIMRPNWRVICVDSVFKKTSFLRHVCSTSLLSNILIHHARIENLNPIECDVAISRAFSSLSKFVEFSGFHVKKDGFLCSMKGIIPKKEIDDLSLISSWGIISIEKLNVPGVSSERCLVIMKRLDNQKI